MLELSPAIRLPRPDEIPDNPEVHERIKERETARIVEGFVIHDNTTNDLPFKYYAEINVDNKRLWPLFKALTDLLPGETCCIYNLYGQEPSFSPYMSKERLMHVLEHYMLELIQDCNLEFGIMYQTEDRLEEIFVTEAKYLRVWGSHEVLLRTVLAGFGLEEVEGIKFVDEYPKVVEPLTSINEHARHTSQVIAELGQYFTMPNNGTQEN